MSSIEARDEAPRLLISAFGIHTGGGLVLLRALLEAALERTGVALLDVRIQNEARAFKPLRARFVRRSFVHRGLELIRVTLGAQTGDVLLCFNSLPPLLRSKAFVVTYVQSAHFVCSGTRAGYDIRTWLRLAIERTWFRIGVKYTDEIWVQTQSMASHVRAFKSGARVRVVPLVDDLLAGRLSTRRAVGSKQLASEASFLYPADAAAHKNHVHLVQAWRMLEAEGIQAKLYLTLDSKELERLEAQSGVDVRSSALIRNLGRLPREGVLRHMNDCSALIFPSLTESYGLPLVEAQALGVPIIASELDYVRDVCSPRESFDPRSPRSIARAVRRFIGNDKPCSDVVSAKSFIRQLLASSTKGATS